MSNFLGRPFAVLVLCLAVGFVGCKKKEPSVLASTQPVGADSVAALPVLKAIALPANLALKLVPTFSKCEGKIKAIYQDANQRLPFTVHFKAQRGVVTMFTVTAYLGIPVATGWVRADSVWVDSKLNGQKIKEPLSRLTEITGLPPDLGVVEGLLTGQYSIPKGFAPVAVTDTSLTAYPLPNNDWQLNMRFDPISVWPKHIDLKDSDGAYSIRNWDSGPFLGPKNTSLVQTDSTGKVLTTLKLEVLSRKFSE